VDGLVLTASKLDLAMACLHWTTIKLPADRSGPAAVFGNAFHSLAATGTHSEELDEESDRLVRIMYEGWKVHGEPLLPPSRRHEVAYALELDGSVRVIGENIGRNYGIVNGIAGTLDVVGDWVVDYKTGKPRVSAAESWQLRFGCVVSGALRSEFHYVRPDGAVRVDRADRTLADVTADSEQLVQLMTRLKARQTPAQPGPHCDAMYCRARPKCDAYNRSRMQKEKQMGKMALSNVKKGRLETPLCVVLYGPEGIGKSTFAAGAPGPIFLGSEDGTSELDVARFPMPANWAECLEALDELASPGHDHKTAVIDTADWIEPLIHQHVCEDAGKAHIEDFGFGKGYLLAMDEWRKLLGRLDALRMQRGMHVIVLAHSQVKTFRNPTGDDYDRYELKLHGKAAALIKEWPKAVLFANYKTYTREKDGRVRGVGDGSRVVYTEHRAAWDAKNRYGLPYEMPLDWSEFEQAARAGQPASAATLLAEIEGLLTGAPADVKKKAEGGIERAQGDARKLSLLVDWLKTKVSESEAA
jgi:hypothetical protein